MLAYTQAPIESELYMAIPKGIELEGANKEDYVLKLLKNLYDQKQGGRVWNQHLVKGLKELGFRQSAVDKCIFYHDHSILLLYVDDSILLGPNEEELKTLTTAIGKMFTIEESGDLFVYLSIQIKREDDGSIHLTQPHLIESMLKAVKLDAGNATGRNTPAMSTKVIHADFDAGKMYQA